MKRLSAWMVRLLLAVSFAGAALAAQTGAEEAVIPGVSVARPDGRWLGVAMEGTSLKVMFYDAQKKPEKPAFTRATVRLRYAARREERFVLNVQGDGLVTEGRPVPRPWVFNALLVLLDGQGEAAETYNVSFSQ